jgi:hypothetical protein
MLAVLSGQDALGRFPFKDAVIFNRHNSNSYKRQVISSGPQKKPWKYYIFRKAPCHIYPAVLSI